MMSDRARCKREYAALTCSGPVASSADLSSRIRINLGNRSEIPLSSAWTNPLALQDIDEGETYQALGRSVDGAQTQISGQNFPYHLRIEPYVWFCPAHFDVPSRFGQFERLQCVVM